MLDPIAADVTRALERYARAHGIDLVLGLVLDRGKLGEMLLVVSASADLTAAFIKDDNAASKPRAMTAAAARQAIVARRVRGTRTAR